MKKYLLLFTLFLSSVLFAQTNGITYQAILYKPNGDVMPGHNNSTVPLALKNVCIQFTIVDASNLNEYVETITVTTDQYGMVNLIIGTGSQTGGYAADFTSVDWTSMQKRLLVGLNIDGQCLNFEEISNQPFSIVPFAYSSQYATSAVSVTGIVPIENGGTNASTVVGAKTNLGLDLVDNTSDLAKPISTATQSALNLKEDAVNKSTDVTLADVSNTKFPTELAVKTFVNGQIVSNTTTLNAAITAVQNDVDANETATTNALALKENAVNKSTDVMLADVSNTKFPTELAVKTFVNGQIVSNTTTLNAAITAVQDNVNANETATTNALALKENAVNKSTDVTLADVSNTKFPTELAVKTFVNGQIVSNTTTLNAAITAVQDDVNANETATTNALALKENAVNKSTDVTLADVSNTKFPTELAVKTFVNGQIISNTTTLNAAITAVQNDVDANETATTNALALKENAVNKSTDVTLADVSNTKFPTELAVKTFVTNQIATGTTTNVSGIVAIANGGTGSSVQNFVDLTNNQSIAGTKLFNSDIVVNGLTIGRGTGQNDQNTALGSGALNSSNANGTRNTAVGALALSNYVGNSFDNNTGVGYFNMIGLTTGGGNTSVGAETMFNVASGSNNTGIGNQSLISTSGNNNVGVGTRSGDGLITGSNNTFLGTQARTTNAGASISNATALGYGAIVTTDNTIQLGDTNVSNVMTSGKLTTGNITLPNTDGTTGQVLTTNGLGIVAWSSPATITISPINGNSDVNGAIINNGALSLTPADATNGGIVTTGTQTFAGDKSFLSDITANGVKLGIGGTDLTAFENVAVGINALSANTSGNRNSAFGESSLSSNTIGVENTAYGSYTLQNNTLGSVNNALGKSALANNVEGNNNTSIGAYSLYFNTSGNNNTAIGNYALFYNNIGLNNVAIGNDSGSNNSGSNNTFLGTNSNSNGLISNATTIGYGAVVNSSNSIQLGNSSVTNVNTYGSITANAEISSEITSNFTINGSNAEQYKGKVLVCNPSSEITITFENNLPVGFNCMVLQKSLDTNKINFAAGSGVTLKNRNNYTATAGNYAIATIVNIGGGIIVTAGDMQ